MTAGKVEDSSAVTNGPHLKHAVNLQFRADWGQANMTRICGWMVQEIGDRAPTDSRFAIWSGRGGFDQTAALLAREIDITVMTPAPAVRMVFDGASPLGSAPRSELRALGVIGQRDRLVVAVDADLPVHTVADLPRVADQLVIATSQDDGINTIGLASHLGLRLAGADPDALRAAGARFLYSERPFPSAHQFSSGEANVLITEAVMMPAWQRIAERRPVRYLDWGAAVFDAFAALGWPDARVPAGYLPGLQHDLRTLDFSDFVVLCREDLPDDIAYLATWCMIKTRKALEAQYMHLPADRTPLTYPIEPADMMAAPIPLHPAAERAYADLKDDNGDENALMWS
ncbi:TAXI family TRAP transporter solute-binding subunit [Rhodococcus erythropolis]|nr:TAXI family TRAP transporter solute-binding subunit [Rhodococcus erythropolis]